MKSLGSTAEDVFEVPHLLRDILRDYLRRSGWVNINQDTWQLNTGPGRWTTCTSLGTAIDAQIACELKEGEIK